MNHLFTGTAPYAILVVIFNTLMLFVMDPYFKVFIGKAWDVAILVIIAVVAIAAAFYIARWVLEQAIKAAAYVSVRWF